MEETVLQVRQLKKYYPWKKNKVKAVDGVEFDIKKGEMVSIVGESGCGKSTLARCIIRLEEATGGQVIFDGEDITFLEHRKMRPVYEKMQMVFQNPYAAFNPRHPEQTLPHPRSAIEGAPSVLSQSQVFGVVRRLIPGNTWSKVLH